MTSSPGASLNCCFQLRSSLPSSLLTEYSSVTARSASVELASWSVGQSRFAGSVETREAVEAVQGGRHAAGMLRRFDAGCIILFPVELQLRAAGTVGEFVDHRGVDRKPDRPEAGRKRYADRFAACVEYRLAGEQFEAVFPPFRDLRALGGDGFGLAAAQREGASGARRIHQEFQFAAVGSGEDQHGFFKAARQVAHEEFQFAGFRRRKCGRSS